METKVQHNRYRPITKIGMGGVAVGNGFNVHDDLQIYETIEAAWDAGVRYYDTSPLYGLGVSEHRLGWFLANKNRDEYTLSSKVGRILEPYEDYKFSWPMWKGKHNFKFRYDYTAAGARRSVEDTLQRMGVSSLDIVFVHNISPDNWEDKNEWLIHFETARKGAMPELAKMRDEGLIKAWGIGVDNIAPLLKCLDVADPDILLAASQYSLVHHEEDVNQLFPKCAERDISVVIGSPLDAGFLVGRDRFLYWGETLPGINDKLAGITRVAKDHHVDVRTAALQFCAAPEVVSGIIPGAHTPQMARENAESYFSTKIPADFWAELKHEKLIAGNAPVPVI